MTYIAKPKVHHPSLQKNAIGLTRRDYERSGAAPSSATSRSTWSEPMPAVIASNSFLAFAIRSALR